MDIKVYYRDGCLPSRICSPDKNNFQKSHFDKKHISSNCVKNQIILYSYYSATHCPVLHSTYISQKIYFYGLYYTKYSTNLDIFIGVCVMEYLLLLYNYFIKYKNINIF